jgi:hypothetical protein
MADDYDDDSFAIDALGNRILIGLSAEETEEFRRLDATICGSSNDDQYGPRERRWLELYEKHETARRRFLSSSKTLH